jgi:hypothetical protein
MALKSPIPYRVKGQASVKYLNKHRQTYYITLCISGIKKPNRCYQHRSGYIVLCVLLMTKPENFRQCLLCTLRGTSDSYYTTPLTALFKGFFHCTECFEPKVAVAASDANVKQIASALSGEGSPRLRISSLDSIFILPLEVN